MPLVSFPELMADAERGEYAVGYFESWNHDSLLAVADAAAATRSPVILGFSGIYLVSPERLVREPLSTYAAMGLDVCRSLSVPACLLFNECPDLERVFEALDLGFTMAMFSDETLPEAEQAERVRETAERAHRLGAAVEGEMAALPGVDGELEAMPEELRLTDPDRARAFVADTGVDCLAVNIGQAHLHGRRRVPLRLDLLARLREALPVPLAVHGASSISPDDFRQAIPLGLRKINVGSVLKQRYLAALQQACARVEPDANPYEVLGSGQAQDVLTSGRLAVQETVEEIGRASCRDRV